MTTAQKPDAPNTPHPWIWDFLNGSAGYMGVYFGDRHPNHPGGFWWRSFLSRELAALQASLLAKEVECEALRERLAFLTQPGALRFVEEDSGMYRAYEDKAPADAEQHFWQSMTTLYYPSAAEAIDAARAAADQGGA